MIKVTNEMFLKAVFGDDYIWAHVTSFPDDPSDIAPARRLACWAGDYYSRYMLQPSTNQYYTVSTFYCDPENGKARRRKALYRSTHVIVADDVREKLPEANALRLPPPSFKLETSPGSEQWGWILTHPATDRAMVENLLDGLVDLGLAPDGKDPGMKGVTRYVRLPEGVNSKRSKLVNGQPRQCVMLEWHPERTVTLEQLAEPFGVDLYAARREQRVDGAADVADHPLLKIPEIINVKEVRSDGRFDITCPWVSQHTGQSDDGAAIFTNHDGSMGFKCHHGHCQDKTGYDLMQHIESVRPGFQQHYKVWQNLRALLPEANMNATAPAPDFLGQFSVNPELTMRAQSGADAGLNPTDDATSIDFLGGSASPSVPASTSFSPPQPSAPAAPQPDQLIGYQDLIDQLVRTPRTTPQALGLAKAVLKSVDSLSHAERLVWWDQVRDHMAWSKNDFQRIVDELRREWYQSEDNIDVYGECVYIGELNQFYHPVKRVFYSVEAYSNSYGHIDDQIRTEALMNGRVEKVDRLDYAPGMPELYTEDGVRYVNSWREHKEHSVPGDVTRWLDHFRLLGWQDHMKHILQWMAYTVRHPERKINHILLLGGGEGNGKDYLLYPLSRAMSRDCTTINGDELLRDFDDYLLTTKYLHINEAELGDRQEARVITNKLKPLGSAPPALLRVNQKGIKPIMIRNVVNVSMTTNSAVPLKLDSGARRYYAVWTDVSIRDPETGDMTDQWRDYWCDRWHWMRDCEGWRACLHYLLTQVDLSDFDPGSVPVVTDFVRDIVDASEDPLLTMMKHLRSERLGAFAADIVSARDIHHTFKMLPMIAPDRAQDIAKIPTAAVIGKVMKQSNMGSSRRCRAGGFDGTLWVIRDSSGYYKMTPGELVDEYRRQMQLVTYAEPLKVVPGRQRA